MQKLVSLVLGIGLALGLAGGAAAAPLNWEGSLTLTFGDFPDAVFPSGGVATVNGSAGGLPQHLSTLRLAPSRGNFGIEKFTLFVTDPDTSGNSIPSIEFTDLELATGGFTQISGGALSNNLLGDPVLPLQGMVKICLFTVSCTQFLPLELTQPTNTTTPSPAKKGVGIGGLLTIGAGGGGAMILIEAAPWTIKTATVTDHVETTGMAGCPPVCDTTFEQRPLPAFAHGPASLVSSTADISGVMQFVSPAQVRTNLPLGSNAKVAVGLLALVHFIPEPGLLLLLGSGVAGLVVLGRRRMRG